VVLLNEMSESFTKLEKLEKLEFRFSALDPALAGNLLKVKFATREGGKDRGL
jgi:hypothetical protein